MAQFFRKHFVFGFCLFIFSLLLFKDPFSERSLIPNFEPYPDALYYTASARNLVFGEGLILQREHRKFVPNIPPLYSLFLAPVFIVNSDPRMFYFINVIISLTSFLIFYKILILLKINKFLSGFTLFLYITNYFLYWFPTLAMAENLTLLLFLGFLLLQLSKINTLNIILASFFSIGLSATKYASMPLTIIFLTAYFIKLFFSWRHKKINIKYVLLFLLIVFLSFIVFFGFEELNKGTSPVSFLKTFSSSITKTSTSMTDSSSVKSSMATSWFSLNYFQLNIGHYLNSITGGSERFLWDFTPLVPKFVGIGGIMGLLCGLFIKRFQTINFVLIAALSGLILFMSTLYTYDMRYIYIAIPTLLLGFGILLNIILEKYHKGYIKICLIIIVSLLFGYYGVSNVIRIKSQISLNLRYSETPWYYVSVLKMNEYFTKDRIVKNKKPIVISALPPYFVDFYSNGNYELLPLSYDQEFRDIKEVIWGPNDYSDLPKLYESYLKKGDDVYLAKYGLGNEGYTNRDYNLILSIFDTKLVFSGCFEQCNIYKLSLKN